MVVGDLIGSGASQLQAIVGKTPNLAARLQGIAKPNGVVIAESTRKRDDQCRLSLRTEKLSIIAAVRTSSIRTEDHAGQALAGLGGGAPPIWRVSTWSPGAKTFAPDVVVPMHCVP